MEHVTANAVKLGFVHRRQFYHVRQVRYGDVTGRPGCLLDDRHAMRNGGPNLPEFAFDVHGAPPINASSRAQRSISDHSTKWQPALTSPLASIRSIAKWPNLIDRLPLSHVRPCLRTLAMTAKASLACSTGKSAPCEVWIT